MISSSWFDQLMSVNMRPGPYGACSFLISTWFKFCPLTLRCITETETCDAGDAPPLRFVTLRLPPADADDVTVRTAPERF